MRHITLTHLKGNMIAVNPLAMLTWGPVQIQNDQGQNQTVTAILFADGKTRNVVESAGVISDMFDRATDAINFTIDARAIPVDNGPVA